METLRVSYSSLGTFSSCPRKFEFDKLYPKRPRDGDSYAADVGSALHAGYQGFLGHQDRDKAIWQFMQAFPFEDEARQENDYRSFEASLSTLIEMFEEVKLQEYELARIIRPANTQEIDAWVKANLEMGKQIGIDFTPEQAPSVEVPAVEVPFEIRFKGISIPPCRRYPEGASLSVIGYIDAIMRHHMTGLYRTLDIKTHRLSVRDATPKYKFDTQQVPYGIVVDHIAEGVVDSFEVLYLDCFIDILEPRVTLYPFMKSKVDIQEWATNKLLQFQRIAQYASADFFPRTENGCMFYNRGCRYMEPCQSRDAEMLESWFLMGEEPGKDRSDEFVPWIVADVNVGGE